MSRPEGQEPARQALFAIATEPSVSRAIAKSDPKRPGEPDRQSLFVTRPATEPAWSLSEGMGAPAGVVYDPKTHELYVSQISGEGDKKDGVGLVSRIDLHGNVLKLWWVSGLNAPKGLALSGQTLWVTDIDEVVAIDVPTGRVSRKIDIDGAKFLTGIAVDSRGTVYVGDLLTSRVYRVDNDRVELFVEGRSLESPGALLVADNRLTVAAWGYSTDYATAVPGSIYFLNLSNRKQAGFCCEPRGNWFGLCKDGGSGFFAADFNRGQIFHVNGVGNARRVLDLPRGCAGLAYVADARLLVVTETRENRVSGYVLSTKAHQK